MREAAIEESFVRQATQHGWLALKLTAPGRGFPDRTVFTPWGVFFIEFKREGGRVSKAQELWLELLSPYGKCCVAYSAAAAMEFIKMHKKRRRR